MLKYTDTISLYSVLNTLTHKNIGAVSNLLVKIGKIEHS